MEAEKLLFITEKVKREIIKILSSFKIDNYRSSAILISLFSDYFSTIHFEKNDNEELDKILDNLKKIIVEKREIIKNQRIGKENGL